MDDIKYFEDAWLELENELSSFQSYQPSPYQQQSSSSSNSFNESSDFATTNLDTKTYEQLLTPSKPELTNNQVHALTTKEDRIQAVRDFYNQNPFTVYAKLNKIANNLYKKGMVKQGNKILDSGYLKIGYILEKALEKNIAYSKKVGDEVRNLSYSQKDGDKIYEVSISLDQGPTITGTFDNLKDALDMFHEDLKRDS